MLPASGTRAARSRAAPTQHGHDQDRHQQEEPGAAAGRRALDLRADPQGASGGGDDERAHEQPRQDGGGPPGQPRLARRLRRGRCRRRGQRRGGAGCRRSRAAVAHRADGGRRHGDGRLVEDRGGAVLGGPARRPARRRLGDRLGDGLGNGLGDRLGDGLGDRFGAGGSTAATVSSTGRCARGPVDRCRARPGPAAPRLGRLLLLASEQRRRLQRRGVLVAVIGHAGSVSDALQSGRASKVSMTLDWTSARRVYARWGIGAAAH